MHDSAINNLFPTLSARSLSGRAYTLPSDLGGEWNVLVMAFQRRQQALVDSWFPFLEQLTANRRDVAARELAILSHAYSLARPFIDGGMIAGIPSPAVRERTLTAYVDVQQVTQALHIPTMTISVLLLDAMGRVRWRGQGSYDAAQAAALERVIDGTA